MQSFHIFSINRYQWSGFDKIRLTIGHLVRLRENVIRFFFRFIFQHFVVETRMFIFVCTIVFLRIFFF